MVMLGLPTAAPIGAPAPDDADDIDPWRTDQHFVSLFRVCPEFQCILDWGRLSGFSTAVRDDVTGFVEKPVRDGVAWRARVPLLSTCIVEDPFSVSVLNDFHAYGKNGSERKKLIT